MVVEVAIAAKAVMTGVNGVIATKAAMTGAIAAIAVKEVMTGAIAVIAVMTGAIAVIAVKAVMTGAIAVIAVKAVMTGAIASIAVKAATTGVKGVMAVHPGFHLDEHSLSHNDLEYAVELVGEDGVRPTPAGKWACASYGQDIGSSSDATTNDDAMVSLKKKKTRITWEV
jgi:hypothetical protein